MAKGITNSGGGGFNKSVIIVTAPTGSTVTCTKGTTVKTATEKNGEWWFKNLDIGAWTLKATLSGQTATQTVNITQFGVYRIAMVYRVTPEFTYTGNYKVVQDNDSQISDFANWKGNWKIRFLTSGTFVVTNFHGWSGYVDAFLVGGGGGGTRGYLYYGGGGGGGGYTYTAKSVKLNIGEQYVITIGSGGSGATEQSAAGISGGNTSCFGFSANGGSGASTNTSSGGTYRGRIGGNGGSAGGTGSSEDNFAAGENGGQNGSSTQSVSGQGSTTGEFGVSSSTVYSGGGGGGGGQSTDASQAQGGSAFNGGGNGGKGGKNGTPGSNGVENTGGGGGGGGSSNSGGKGGAGIVIIRNSR